MKNEDIEKFNGFDIQIEYKKVVDEYAEKCKDLIQQNAKRVLKEHRGKYVNGWTEDVQKTYGGGYSVVVWNKTDWQLTHLLEDGHRIVNKKGGEGWASAHPHIDPAYRSVKNKFVKAMENVKINIDDE